MVKQREQTRYMDEWIRVPLCNRGEKLYHYTTAEGVQGIVKNKQFIATQRDYLNDKMEFLYAFQVMEALVNTYIVNEALRHRFLNLVEEEMRQLAIAIPSCQVDCTEEVVMQQFYVVAFSKLENSALLWAEFTDFKGYCLGFDYARLVEGFQGRVFLHGTVIYDEKVQTQCLLDALLSCIRGGIDRGLSDLEGFFEEESNPGDDCLLSVAEDMAVVCSIYAMFFKKEFFAGEEEYRFVFSPSGRAQEAGFRIVEQVFLPYIKVEYDDSSAGLPIESVMVGAKNNTDIAVRGVRAFLREEGLEIPVTLSDIPLRY